MDSPAQIMVVDDQPSSRELLAAMVESLGHQVVEAADGAEALRKMGPRVDLVLLDIMMPGMDGVQVLERLRQQEEWRAVPVVVVSALDDLDTVVRCIDLGADDYLAK